MIKTELIPVIHIIEDKQLLLNAKICVEAGIQKVFLIDHFSSNPNSVLESAKVVKEHYPNLWIGINPLGASANRVLLNEFKGIDGIWCDDSVTIEEYNNRVYKGMYFGGLAFKYQRQPTNLEEASRIASLSTDVACTSGPGTGQPATLTKINAIRKGLGDHPMAIASGVSIDNINSYKGLVNYLLVASSITNDLEIIKCQKLDELISSLK